MNDFELNESLFSYMSSIGANPKKELLKISSSKLISHFSHYFSSELFDYNLEKITMEEINKGKDVFICQSSSVTYDYYEINNGKVIAKNGKAFKEEKLSLDDVELFRIVKVAKKHDENTLFKTIMALTPSSGYLTIPLVLFGILSPLYSNVFNSRLVYANSNLTFFVITSVFLFFTIFEYVIKKYIKDKSAIQVQKNNTLLSDYFFEIFKISKANNIAVKIRNIEQTTTFIWESIPLLYVDVAFVFLYSFCILIVLGFHSVVLFAYYGIIAALMIYVRFSSYKELISSMKNAGEKANFLFSFERKKTDLLFSNSIGSNSVFIDTYSIDDINKIALDSQNHKWGELVKMNSFVSMIVMYFSCFLSIQAGMLQISAVIAVMIVNSRLSSSLTAMIAKFYQLKVQKHNFMESSTQLFKNVRNIGGIKLQQITSVEAQELSKDFLAQKNIPSLTKNFEFGKMYALVGANGSGKTSLLKVLSGYDVEYEGDLNFNKVSTKNISQHTLANNVTFHSANSDFIKSSLKRNFEFYGITDLKTISEIIKFASPKFELDHDKFELIEADQLNFSNGEKQKMLLAMSLMKNPDVIFLDESTSFLSKSDSIRTMQWIKNTYKESLIIFATHDPDLVNMADEQILLQPSNANKVVVNLN